MNEDILKVVDLINSWSMQQDKSMIFPGVEDFQLRNDHIISIKLSNNKSIYSYPRQGNLMSFVCKNKDGENNIYEYYQKEKLVFVEDIRFYPNGISHLYHNKDSGLWVKWHYKAGQLHREKDLPAVEYSNGTKFYFVSGKLHRGNNLPAIEKFNGIKEYYVDEKLFKAEKSKIENSSRKFNKKKI